MKKLEDALKGEPNKWYFRPGIIARYSYSSKTCYSSLSEFMRTRIANFLAFTR